MQKFITIDIPTKPYIKAYVIGKLGELPIMTTGRQGDTIGHKLYDLLQHSNNEYKYRYEDNVLYTATLRVRIPMRTFKKRGQCLNETNTTNFNLFIEQEVKEKFYFIMSEYFEVLPSVENNLPAVRKKLKIDEDHWSDETMIKLFYRYRKANQDRNKEKSNKVVPQLSGKTLWD